VVVFSLVFAYLREAGGLPTLIGGLLAGIETLAHQSGGGGRVSPSKFDRLKPEAAIFKKVRNETLETT
jgi:hypothetical protein